MTKKIKIDRVIVDKIDNKYVYSALIKGERMEQLRMSSRLYETCHLHTTRCGSAGKEDRLGNFFTFGRSPSPYHHLEETFFIVGYSFLSEVV